MKPLTARQREVIEAMIRGHVSDKALAEELGITLNTVGRHIAEIFNRTGVHDRVNLVIKAMKEKKTA